MTFIVMAFIILHNILWLRYEHGALNTENLEQRCPATVLQENNVPYIEWNPTLALRILIGLLPDYLLGWGCCAMADKQIIYFKSALS